MLHTIENICTELSCKQGLLGVVIIKNVCNATNSIKHKFFVFFDGSLVHCVAQTFDEFAQKGLYLVELFTGH